MICSTLVAIFLSCGTLSDHVVYEDHESGAIHVIAYGVVYNFGLPPPATAEMIELDFDADEQLEQFIEDCVATVDP